MGIADIGIRVTLDDAASAGLAGLSQGLLTLESSLKRTNSAFHEMSGLQLAALGVFAGSALAFTGFGLAIKYAIDRAGDWEQNILKMKLSVQGTTQQFEQMKSKLIDVSDKSVYTIGQMADAVYNLGLKGFTAKDMTDHLIQGVKNLGEAIRTDPVSAAKLLGTTLKEFQIPVKDTTHTVDLLQYAFEHGIPNTQRLETALSRVGPTASTLRIPLREVTTALDIMAQNMQSGADVGGMLRYVLQSMSAPTAGQTKILEQLGIITSNTVTPAFTNLESALAKTSSTNKQLVTSFDGSASSMQQIFSAAQKVGLVPLSDTFGEWGTKMGLLNNKFYDSQGNFKDFISNLNTLNDATKNLTVQQKAAIFSTGGLFNTKSGQGAGVLLGHIKDVNAMLQQLIATSDNAGTAQERAAQQEATYNGRMSELKTTIQSAAMLIGGPLRDAVSNAVQAFLNLLNPMVGVLSVSPQIGATFLLVGLAVSAAGMAISAAFIPAIGTIVTLVGIMAGTVAVIVAIAVIATVIVANWGTVERIWKQNQVAIQGLGLAALALAGAFAGVQVAGLIAGFSELIPEIIATGTAIVTTLIPDLIASAIAYARQVIVTVALAISMSGTLIPAIWASAVAWVAANVAMLATVGVIILIVAAVAAAVVGLVLLLQHVGVMNSLSKAASSI